MKKSKFSFLRFTTIIKKEIRQIRRDPFSMRMPIILPILLMFLFGYAITTEIDNINTAVLDLDKTTASREYIDNFVASGYFKVFEYVDNEDEIIDLLDSGKIKAAIIIPQGFNAEIQQGKEATAALWIDGSDPTTARSALSGGSLISSQYSIDLLKKSSSITSSVSLPVNLSTMMMYNPNQDMKTFSIPGLVGLILQNITILLTAFSLVREKERGTMEQLIVTPIKNSELILGKIIPYIVIGYISFLFSLAICIFWFGVWPKGNILILLLGGFLYVLTCLCIGMLISSWAKNQFQAMLSALVFILPNVLLSGFIFPIESMPRLIQFIAYVLPLTYFLETIRGIMIKDVSFGILYSSILSITIISIIILLLTAVKFKKRLD